MKILEASSGLMARIVEQSDYDGIWVSSLCHSTSLGLPDNELIPLKDRVDLVREIRRVSTKPIIVDIDTGGDIQHLAFAAKWFEDAGAHALIMEDKRGAKQNSLIEGGKHEMEEIDTFCEKIKVIKQSSSIKIYARLESLIAKRSRYEAVLRARAYLEAGVDGIMVHSKIKLDPTEVMEVAKEIRAAAPDTTLIAVPTTYILPADHPFDIIIDANQMTRASVAAMKKYASGQEVELADVPELFELCGS